MEIMMSDDTDVLTADYLANLKKVLEDGLGRIIANMRIREFNNTNKGTTMDKKYVWAKDMPFVDKGTLVRLAKCSSDEERYYFNNGEIFISDLGFDALIAQGWIKEVKPREFKMTFMEDRLFLIELDGKVLYSRIMPSEGVATIIKAREY